MNEFEVINDESLLLERLSKRNTFNNFAMYSTDIEGFTTDKRFFK